MTFKSINKQLKKYKKSQTVNNEQSFWTNENLLTFLKSMKTAKEIT